MCLTGWSDCMYCTVCTVNCMYVQYVEDVVLTVHPVPESLTVQPYSSVCTDKIQKVTAQKRTLPSWPPTLSESIMSSSCPAIYCIH
jgi:hypothetical protein